MLNRTLLLIAVIAVLPRVVARPPAVDAMPRDYWLGVYYKNVKIGYMHVSLKAGKRDGKDVVTRDDVLAIRARYGANELRKDFSRMLSADESFGVAVEKMGFGEAGCSESGSTSMGLEISYNSHTMDWTSIVDGQVRKQTVPFTGDDRVITVSGKLHELGIKTFSVGDKTTVQQTMMRLKPTVGSMTPGFWIGKVSVSVPRKEKVEAGGTSYDTLVVVGNAKLGKITQWLLPNGDTVKISIPAEDTTVIREPKDKAREIESGKLPDLKQIVGK